MCKCVHILWLYVRILYFICILVCLQALTCQFVQGTSQNAPTIDVEQHSLSAERQQRESADQPVLSQPREISEEKEALTAAQSDEMILEEITALTRAPALNTAENMQAINSDTYANQPTLGNDELARTKELIEPKAKWVAARSRCPVSPNRLATLQSLSYEIMTNTLPIEKMKRILPEEKLSIHEQWPILSNYRKQTVLPSVKAGKQRLAADMSNLHAKINEYFKCDNFPLWQYKYVPKDHTRRYRLLKAIETERIPLPTLPKH